MNIGHSQESLSQRLLTWFQHHGRHDLPWQQTPNAYRIWISEIMLQQTQVNTVIPFYQRFVQRFPDIQTLAQSPLDTILHYWSGLGYYARARNLHRAAQEVVQQHQGQLPRELESLMRLPGIGRSTAAAILALSDGQPQPILDGNVKRVLCRYYALAGWPGEPQVAKQLWQLAEYHTPKHAVRAYTQAIMDLGATVCTRRAPLCQHCPLNQDCLAYQHHQVDAFPKPKPRKKLPVRTTLFLMLQNSQGALLLHQRPPQGIWGGLWSFPQCAHQDDIAPWYRKHIQAELPHYSVWPQISHRFTHFQLDITPIYLPAPILAEHPVALSPILWYNIHQPQVCGLAAPVARLLAQLASSKTGV